MPLKKLLAVTLLSAIFLAGCHADAGSLNAGPSGGIPKTERPKSEALFPAPATFNPAPAAPAPAAIPDGNKDEIVDLSLG